MAAFLSRPPRRRFAGLCLFSFGPTQFHIGAFCLFAGCAVASAPADATDGLVAAEVVAYEPGSNPVPGYTNPQAALGEPTRFTGGDFDPMVVSVLNPAWRPDEIVSIGEGGSLTVRFAKPVTDDPANPFGVDLLVFGNAFFSAGSGNPPGVGSPAAMFAEGGEIAVSSNGVDWFDVVGVEADGAFPTSGYLDVVDPYADSPGDIPADFHRPVNPALGVSSFSGLSIEEVQTLYAGSGGGVGIDLQTVGLASIQFVRITNPNGSGMTPEIDAVTDVVPRSPGDVDGDGVVDVNDLLGVLERWGPSQPSGWDADFNIDGVVDVSDLLLLLAHWS